MRRHMHRSPLQRLTNACCDSLHVARLWHADLFTASSMLLSADASPLYSVMNA